MKNDLIVLVKKYFDKVNGNTYHSVQFEINDKIYHSGKTYGYERQYEQTTKDILLYEVVDVKTEYVAFNHITFNNGDEGLIKYRVIENCEEEELKEIHEYK